MSPALSQPQPGEPGLWCLTLYPHRSERPAGQFWLVLVCGLLCALAVLRFVAVGAWPVALFVLIDIALLWLAFWFCRLSGRMREELQLTDRALVVTRFSTRIGGALRSQSWRLEPTWLKTSPVITARGQRALELTSRGARIAIGQFLTDTERREVQQQIEGALARWRQRGAGSAL